MILSLLATTLWLMTGPIHASTELSDCSAFPVLAEVMDQLHTLEHAPNETSAMLTALRIERLRKEIPSNQLRARLEELGFERHLTQVTAFRVRLGALTHIARTNGRTALRPYLFGSGFQRSKQHTHELLERICEDTPSSTPSHSAQRKVTLWTGTGLSRQKSLSVAMGFGAIVLLIAMLAGAHSYSEWNRRSKRRVRKRVACNIPAIVTIHGTACHASLVDISMGGANLAHTLELLIGTHLHLQFGDTAVDGTVMWSNNKFAGIRFARVLSEQELPASILLKIMPRGLRHKKRGAQSGTA